MLLDYLWDNYFFYQFLNNFLALLLCKINIVDMLVVIFKGLRGYMGFETLKNRFFS